MFPTRCMKVVFSLKSTAKFYRQVESVSRDELDEDCKRFLLDFLKKIETSATLAGQYPLSLKHEMTVTKSGQNFISEVVA